MTARSITSFRFGGKRAPEQKTEDLAGDRVSTGWIRDHLGNLRPPIRPRDRYDDMAERIETKRKARHAKHS